MLMEEEQEELKIMWKLSEMQMTIVNWNAPVDPYDLAKWGFYYLGTDDVARCYFCRLEVRGWEQGDRGDTEHERWNSACPFLRGREVGNIPLGQEQPRNVHSDSANVAIDAGRGDRVICFYCGGGLKDWGAGDRAWVEHAVWFQNCQYLQLIKGPPFVEQVRALRVAQSACELQQFNQSTVNAVQPPSPQQAVQAPPTQAVQQPTQQPISTETANQQQSDEASGLSTEPKPQEEASTARSTEATEMSDDGIRACKVCFQKELGIVFLPCGHMATCPDCAPQLRNCPICRTVASAYIRAYLP
ncbi:hypothetical protein B566_EDAN018001 [Ephemera danica]|nr:hypothetical protein B566_EDAN018001 [Ephemera danica]